jgi:hypothetical protein
MRIVGQKDVDVLVREDEEEHDGDRDRRGEREEDLARREDAAQPARG